MRCVVEGCRPVRSLISLSDTASSREANTSINVNMRSRTWTLGLGEAALSFFFMRRRGVSAFGQDRKSTRLNSSHLVISYAVFCLKKKNNNNDTQVLQCMQPWH